MIKIPIMPLPSVDSMCLWTRCQEILRTKEERPSFQRCRSQLPLGFTGLVTDVLVFSGTSPIQAKALERKRLTEACFLKKWTQWKAIFLFTKQ